MLEIDHGDTDIQISDEQLKTLVEEWAHSQGEGLKRVLLIPPDHTRLNSKAGLITSTLYALWHREKTVHIMPALGTHFPMTKEQCIMMFGDGIPQTSYLNHDWRHDLEILGRVNEEEISRLSENKLHFSLEVGVNKKLLTGDYDLILSIGQVVPHEVIGMANYTKNILVGVGGGDTIHKSHYLGAVYGMERIMGETYSPVREVLNDAYDTFVRPRVKLKFMLTVIGKDDGQLATKGFFVGEHHDTFERACQLSRAVNINHLDRPIKKCVVYLDPDEFHSTWLGNKAIYRTRKAMADDGELIILAPALKTFGEDQEIDRLIRKYGYWGTEQTLQDVENNAELKNNLSAAAHLIHGTSDGRFKITYCPGEGLSEKDIAAVGFAHLDLEEALRQYPFEKFKEGWNQHDGEDIFYVSNPALGLWSHDPNGA
jgi:nickel-dependent lactate racemase